MTKIEDAIAILESLKQEHYVSLYDSFACPKSEACSDSECSDIPISERPCDWGMDELNAGLESAIAILRSVQNDAMKYESKQRPMQANHMSIDRNGILAPSLAKRKFIEFEDEAEG